MAGGDYNGITKACDIINFFERRATNAAAESFNAKIKAFRGQRKFLVGNF